ncbi:TM2 domain-containing protein [Bacillus sp. RG28]|uniref:TM2 domain-containing protein n=1 Tax=Gottfriedia endophytica TaxID=2820819 RepID=A0A940NMZ6_9BACI|nr:TM2 domain-containing protein [Gottfriedia endophytica]MBP0723671.1 TM2 domain-containing protein [Gottfriedia endophytica]
MYNLNISKMDLTLEELAVLESEMLKKKKSKEAAWGLWAVLHFIGGHRFYTENYKYATAMLLTTIIPFFAIITLFYTVEYFNLFTEILMYIFIILLIGSVIWTWIDAFYLNKRIDTLNENTENLILDAIRERRNLRKPE